MAEHKSPLADPLELPCGVKLRNRIGKAALSEQLATVDGFPTPNLISLYREWGKSGAGFLLTGNVMIDRRYKEGKFNVVLEDKQGSVKEGTLNELHKAFPDMSTVEADGNLLRALKVWAKESQKEGCQTWVQINHSGRQTPRVVNKKPVAPSVVKLVDDTSKFFSFAMGMTFAEPRELALDEIAEVIKRFAATASLVKEAGFAGCEIHAAHGYLLSEFLSSKVNQRSDQYGGSPENRRRLLLEVVRAVRVAVGPSYPVAVKLNSADFQKGGFTEEESLEVVKCLLEEKVDLIEISGGTYEMPALISGIEDESSSTNSTVAQPPSTEVEPLEEQPTAEEKKVLTEDAIARINGQQGVTSTQKREVFFLEFAKKVRKIMPRGPGCTALMLSGGFRTVALMEAAIGEGVDVVGLGRPFSLDPRVAERILSGKVSKVVEASPGIGVRKIDNLLQSMWHQEQMERIAKLQTPDLKLGNWCVLARGQFKLYM